MDEECLACAMMLRIEEKREFKLIRQEEALRHAHNLTEHFITGNYDPHVKRWAKEILTAIEAGLSDAKTTET